MKSRQDIFDILGLVSYAWSLFRGECHRTSHYIILSCESANNTTLNGWRDFKKVFYIGKPYKLQSHGVSVDIYKYLDLNSDEWSDFICLPMVT